MKNLIARLNRLGKWLWSPLLPFQSVPGGLKSLFATKRECLICGQMHEYTPGHSWALGKWQATGPTEWADCKCHQCDF